MIPPNCCTVRVRCGRGLFQPRLPENGIYCFRMKVTFLFAHRNRDLSGFGWMYIVVMVTFRILVLPTIRKDNLFHVLRTHSFHLLCNYIIRIMRIIVKCFLQAFFNFSELQPIAALFLFRGSSRAGSLLSSRWTFESSTRAGLLFWFSWFSNSAPGFVICRGMARGGFSSFRRHGGSSPPPGTILD